MAAKMRQINQFGNFSRPTWTFLRSQYRDASQELETSALSNNTYLLMLKGPSPSTDSRAAKLYFRRVSKNVITCHIALPVTIL